VSRSWPCRAQTEPVAALVAVSAFALGIGLYAVVLGGALSDTTDPTTADRTIDRIWDDLETEGAFHAHDDRLVDRVTGDAVPAGATVYVRVTAIEGGEERTVAEAAFPPGYPHGTTRTEGRAIVDDVDAHGPPEGASVATRPIPIALENRADVRSGTLRVIVW